MKKFVLLCALATAFATFVSAEDKNADIITAAKSYVAANSSITKFTATVEQVADDFARVKVAPDDAKAADPAWVFLQKKEGKWTGLTLGSSFTTEDYQQMGIPNSLRIP